MNNSDQENRGTINFYERYSNDTDAQIMEILRNQKDYQESAKNAAVKIAIERQLINSESDLLAPEFQGSKSTRLTLFPQIASSYHHQRLVSSIFRFLYILSFLPIIYGFLKYGEGNIDQTILGTSIGVAWFLLVLLFKRTRKSIVLAPLFGILIFVGASISLKIVATHPGRVLDFFILIVGLLLSAYFLTFVQKLIQNTPED
jgi:hypothetical protein